MVLLRAPKVSNIYKKLMPNRLSLKEDCKVKVFQELIVNGILVQDMSNKILQTSIKGHKTVLHTQVINHCAVKIIMRANMNEIQQYNIHTLLLTVFRHNLH